MSDDCTCLFGHEPGEICRRSSPIPEECSHWKTTRSMPCKVCGKLTFSTSGRCLLHIRSHAPQTMNKSDVTYPKTYH
nr:659_t:CDS:2 [Entrophospora candida]